MQNYHIYDTIGRGKHSTVYKGRRKKTIQYFAVKSVEKSQRQRVMQEVQALRAIDSANVLRFHAWYETNNHLWLVLEYCVGGDLQQVLKHDQALPESTLRPFAADLARGLACVHSKNILHCDLKPKNVMVDEDGHLKLCGFGLSRRLSEPKALRQAPGKPRRRGSPSYMAPELFTDDGSHSSSSDLYAFGCILFECAAGHPPFRSSSLEDLVACILREEPPPLPSHCSADLCHLVNSLLAKSPCDRFHWRSISNSSFWDPSPELRPPDPTPDLLHEPYLSPSSFSSVDESASNGVGEEPASTRDDDEKVDIQRLSQIAQGNLAFRQEEDAGIEGGKAELDFNGAEPASPTSHDDVTSGFTEYQQERPTGESASPRNEGSQKMEMTDDKNDQQEQAEAYDEQDWDEALVFTESDEGVKPIAGNRRIESQQEQLPKPDERKLPFKAITARELESMPKQDADAFLSSAATAMASHGADKAAGLAHLERLAASGQRSANLIVSSPLAPLALRLARAAPNPTVRTRATSCLGSLARHCTQMGETLPSESSVAALAECTKDKHPPARRRAIACLGEVCFYLATQGTSVPREAVVALARSLRPGDDATAQHYAVKAAENALTPAASMRDGPAKESLSPLATTDVCSNLVALAFAKDSRGEHLRATACSALARAVRAFPAALRPTLERRHQAGTGSACVCALAKDSSARVQQPALNLLCLSLLQHAAVLSEAQSAVRTLEEPLCETVERSSPLLAAKALLVLALLVRRRLASLKPRLAQLVDRLAPKSLDSHLRDCLTSLQNACANAALRHLRFLSSSASSSKLPESELTELRLALASPSIGDRALSDGSAVEMLSGACQSMDDEAAAGTLEACSEASRFVGKHRQALLGRLVPALMGMAGDSRGRSKDARFLALKLTCDCLLPILAEDTGPLQDDLSECFRGAVLPAIAPLLDEEDPTPLYCLKLLGAAMDRGDGGDMPREACRLGLHERTFAFMALDHGNNNVHNVRICLHIARSSRVESHWLAPLSPGPRVRDVLWYAFEHHVEPFMEPALGICLSLIRRDLADRPSPFLAADLPPCAPVFAEVSAAPDKPLSSLASSCLSSLCGLLPDDTASEIASAPTLARLPAILDQLRRDAEAGSPPPEHSLDALLSSLVASLRRANVRPDAFSSLLEPARSLLAHFDSSSIVCEHLQSLISMADETE